MTRQEGGFVGGKISPVTSAAAQSSSASSVAGSPFRNRHTRRVLGSGLASIDQCRDLGQRPCRDAAGGGGRGLFDPAWPDGAQQAEGGQCRVRKAAFLRSASMRSTAMPVSIAIGIAGKPCPEPRSIRRSRSRAEMGNDEKGCPARCSVQPVGIPFGRQVDRAAPALQQIEVELPIRVSRETLTAALERVKGIEPSYAAWEAAVLPLNYTPHRTCRFL